MTLLKLTDRDGDIWYQSVDGADSYTLAVGVTEPFEGGREIAGLIAEYAPVTAETYVPEAPNVTLTIPATEAAALFELLGWNVAQNAIRDNLSELYDALYDVHPMALGVNHPFVGTVTKAG